jgi:hypothetical protein
MPANDTFTVTCPLESVSPLEWSKATPGAAENSTKAPATPLPCSSFTCTTTGCGNKLPVCAVCFSPLDAAIATPNAVALGSEVSSDRREQEAATRAIKMMKRPEQ